MELKRGYKQSEVGLIPDDWDVRRIGDIAAVSSGGTPSRSNPAYWKGDIAWITTSQIDFNVISGAEEFITREGLENSAAKMFPVGTLLMAMYGQGKTRGKVAVLGCSAATNQACAALLLSPAYCPDYLFHYLASKYQIIRKLSNSGSQENLSGLLIKSIQIALPPFPEQRAIAKALSDVDSLLVGLDRLIAKKRDIKRAAMHQLLTGKIRLPGPAATPAKTPSNILDRQDWPDSGLSADMDPSALPEGWKAATLGDMTIKVGSGITPTGGEQVYRTSGRPFLRSQNVGWGELLLEDIAFIDEATHSGFDATEVHAQDVLLNITGASIGRSALADSRVEGGNVNQHVCLIRTIGAELYPAFLNYFLLSALGQRQIESFQAGGNRQGLNFGQIRSFEIPHPALCEQKAISAVLSDMDAEIGALEKQRTKTRDLKQAMRQELLIGRTRLV